MAAVVGDDFSGAINQQGCRAWLQPIIWAVSSAVVFAVSWAIVQPEDCLGQPACAGEWEASAHWVHGAIVCALLAFLLNEVWGLVVTYRVAKPLVNFIDNVTDAFFPHTLVCIMLAILVLENLNFFAGVDAYFVHAGSAEGPRGPRPVLTGTIIEWLINVPMLITLAGHALGRSLKQVTFAVVATNVYICTSWIAFFVDNEILRWLLIVFAFLMYSVVSVDMFRWIGKPFRQSKVWYADGRRVRQGLCIGLVVDFAVYGVIYAASMCGGLTSTQERVAYTVLNVGTKFVFALTYATLRLLSYHASTVDVIINKEVPWERNPYDMLEEPSNRMMDLDPDVTPMVGDDGAPGAAGGKLDEDALRLLGELQCLLMQHRPRGKGPSQGELMQEVLRQARSMSQLKIALGEDPPPAMIGRSCTPGGTPLRDRSI